MQNAHVGELVVAVPRRDVEQGRRLFGAVFGIEKQGRGTVRPVADDVGKDASPVYERCVRCQLVLR